VLNIKGAIFDLDGTLLDSMWLWDTVGSNYLKKLGIDPPSGWDDRFKTMSMDQGATYIKNYCNLNKSVPEIMQEIDDMIACYYDDVFNLKPGIAELLSKFQSADVKMCVASLTNGYLVQKALKRNNILPYFSKIFSCRDLGISKHEPQIYQIAGQYLGFDKTQIAVFEDAPFAIKTAKDAGFIVVGVNDPSYKEHVLERRQWADYFVENGDFVKVLSL
jgi:HAD superfamily hydrolase (TIGR01509 family)